MPKTETTALVEPVTFRPEPPEPSPLYREWLSGRRIERWLVRLTQLALVALFLGLWEVAPRMHWVNPMLTSYPSAIWPSFLQMLQEGEIGLHTRTTIIETVVSFLISMALGTLVAFLLWLSPFVCRVLDPFFVVANAIPKIALVPIFYIWLGAEMSIYGIAVTISIFITLLMIYTGFTQTDPNKIKLLRTFGATNLQILSKVVLPSNVPTLIAALKANVGLSLVGVIVGEFQSAKAGLGYVIVYGSQIFKMDMVMTAIVILALISLALYGAIQYLERVIPQIGRRATAPNRSQALRQVLLRTSWDTGKKLGLPRLFRR
jgi:NitT/TauT family transport system permease protein